MSRQEWAEFLFTIVAGLFVIECSLFLILLVVIIWGE